MTSRSSSSPRSRPLWDKPDYRRLQAAFADAAARGVANPYFSPHEGTAGATSVINGRTCINFANYNYLATSGHPHVQAQARQAIDQYGTSVSASRLVSGEIPLHGQLDQALARFLGTAAALTFVSGHATNVTTIGHVLGPRDLVLHDVMAHNSIVQGCRLSRAQRRAFPHNDIEACARLLHELRDKHRRTLIAIEGVYSMDGDVADLPAFLELKRRFDTALLVDEAHSLGTLGARGAGLSEHFAIDPADVDLWIGTLSKSLGSCGGYVAGSREMVEYLKYTAPGFVFSVGMPPPNAAAALAALELIEREPQRVRCLADRAAYFLGLAKRAGLDTGISQGTPIVPVIIREPRRTLCLSQRLLERGIWVAPILPPGVPENATRLRFFLSCEHTPEQLQQTAAAVAEELALLTGGRPTATLPAAIGFPAQLPSSQSFTAN